LSDKPDFAQDCADSALNEMGFGQGIGGAIEEVKFVFVGFECTWIKWVASALGAEGESDGEKFRATANEIPHYAGIFDDSVADGGQVAEDDKLSNGNVKAETVTIGALPG